MHRLLGLLVLIAFVGCNDPVTPEPPAPPPIASDYRILVGNEGGFTFGNASISLITPATGMITNEVFQSANGRPLGDVLQDARLIDGNLWLVLNNANRIEIVDTSDYSVIQSITGLTSPRYVEPVAPGKVYVTDFQADSVHIIDRQRLEKTGTIALEGWTEELIKAGDLVFITNRFSNYVYVVDPAQDEIVDRIAVAYGSGAVGQDAAGMLWVYCAGDAGQGFDGGLYRIDPVGRTVLDAFPLSVDVGLFPRLAFDAERDTLFYLQDGLRQMNIEAVALPDQPLIADDGINLYGIGYDSIGNQVLIADAKDFQQRGEVLLYDRAGERQGAFQVGIIPAFFRVFD